MLQWETGTFVFHRKLAAIGVEDRKLRSNSRPFFSNKLRLIYRTKPSSSPTKNKTANAVDAVRIMRVIPIKDLYPAKFTVRVKKILSYIEGLTGKTLHLVFDNYIYSFR